MALCGTVAAQEFAPVTDRDFTLDLHQGAVLGSGRIVGMGGAHAAIAQGAAGMTANPASVGVRSATSRTKWDWDWNVDWLNPEVGDDFDNNGAVSEEEQVDKTLVLTGGVVVYRNEWGFGVSFSSQSFELGDPDDDEPDYITGAAVLHVVVARSFLDNQLVAALGVRVGALSLERVVDGPQNDQLIDISGSAGEAGVVWMPKDMDIRVGGSGAIATETNKVNENCDPLDCEGFILPSAVEAPWTVSAGVAWRRAKSRWNKQVKGHFRDERSLILAADVVVTGPVANGFGVEEYVLNSVLQPSGRETDLSIRLGAEYEWKPGVFRIRGGTYYEPARFKDVNGQDIAGRQHVTLGFDWRIYSFDFWGKPRRLRLSLTTDSAPRYGNGALSVGLWQ